LGVWQLAALLKLLRGISEWIQCDDDEWKLINTLHRGMMSTTHKQRVVLLQRLVIATVQPDLLSVILVKILPETTT
jgi:hypothetical protein